MGTLIQFLKDSWSEIKNVSWPKGEELVRHTAMVIVVIVVFGAITTVVDMGMKFLFDKLPVSNAAQTQTTPINPEDLKVTTTPITSSGAKAK